MRKLISLTVLSVVFYSCAGQNPSTTSEARLVGGRCQGCEAVLEGTPSAGIEQLPEFNSGAPKLKITGTVYDQSGNPVPGVVIYAYHTNQEGIYPKKDDAQGWGDRHGYLRGWVKTDTNGQYTFLTTRPAGYPDSNAPQHVHMTIQEPDGRYYYIDDIFFTDDERLESSGIQQSSRGGSGISTPVRQDGMWQVTRDIILGRNIPEYSPGN